MNNPIRLLFVESSSTEAEALNAQLRRIGLAVRPYFYNSGDDITDMIEKQDPAIILIRHDHSELSIQDLNSYVTTLSHPIPIIALYADEDEIDLATLVKQGATLIINDDEPEYLAAAIQSMANVTTLKRDYANLKRMYDASEARCKTLLHSSKDAIAYVHEGVHVYANLSYLERHGFKHFDDIEGLPLMDLVPDSQQADLKSFLRDIDVSGEDIRKDLTFTLADGIEQTDTVEFSATDMDGESCLQLIIRHIEPAADTAELEEKINLLAKQDSLTGLLNRQAFVDDFTARVAQMQNNDSLQFAYFHIELDHYEDIFNQIGALSSDQLIKNISEQLATLLDESHPVCRYRGGIFSYVSAISNHEVEARDIGKYVLSCLESVQNKVDNHTLELNFKIGICLIEDDSLSVSEAMMRGENALKQTNADEPCAIYKPKEGELTQAQLDKSWDIKIDSALKNKSIHILYRPMLNLTGNTDTMYQASLRLLDTDGNTINSEDYMPSIQRTGMATKLDLWLLQESFKSIAQALPKQPNLKVLMRLSALSLGNAKFCTVIKRMVNDLKLPEKAIAFEFAYEDVKNNVAGAKLFFNEVRSVGCECSIYDMLISTEAIKPVAALPWQFIKFNEESTKNLVAQDAQTQADLKELNEGIKVKKAHSVITYVNDPMAMSVAWTSGFDYMQGDFIGEASQTMNFDFASAMG